MSIQGTTTRLFDMEKICRTCLKIGELQSIYEKIKYSEEDLTIASLLTEFSVMQISEEDGLPTQICIECTKEISKCYIFIKKCQLSDEILRQHIQEYTKDAKQISVKDQQINKDVEVKSETENEEDLPLTQVLRRLNSNSRTLQNEDLYNSFDPQDNSSDDEVIKVEPIEDLKSELLDSENVTEYKKISRKKTKHKNKSISQYECKSCSILFQTHEELLEHKRTTKHPKNQYTRRPCDICHKPVVRSRMSQHMRTHTQEKPYICELCGASFSVGSNLRRHTLARHTEERPYKCKLCQRGFTRLALLRDHVRTHTGEKPYVCNYCGKSFAQPSSFKTHLFIHAQKGEGDIDIRLSNNMYNCVECERVFATRALLNAHRVVHGEKKFLCSDCGRRFVTLVLLKSHSKVHTGVRPHGCAVCGKTFAHIGSLKSHSLIHSGQKPFVCKVCGRAFTQQNHIKYHMRTHSGERPYSCSVCGKTFALNGNLTVHMRTHTGETPYLCPTCGKGFHDSSSMKKHQRAHGQLFNR